MLLAVAGCDMVAPSHDYYQYGVAKIGDTYHLFAPLCDDERLTGVVLRDQGAMVEQENPDVDRGAYDYWKVSDPVGEDTASGWVTIGDDAAFRTVEVAAGSRIPLPEHIEVRIEGTAPGGSFAVGGFAFRVAEVPEYPSGGDPKTVRYGYRFGSDDVLKLTPGEISERSKCAREYVA